MKKEKRSCLRANFPETGMKCIVCYDGEVVIQTHRVSDRKNLVSISVKGGSPHQISNELPLEVTVLHGKVTVQVKGRKKITYEGTGGFAVPANSWMKVTAYPFAQFFATETIGPELGDPAEEECILNYC
jgi:hypothetical protein